MGATTSFLISTVRLTVVILMAARLMGGTVRVEVEAEAEAEVPCVPPGAEITFFGGGRRDEENMLVVEVVRI